MSYYSINLKYPLVRKEEYSCIRNTNIHKAIQFPIVDPVIKLPTCKTIGLSFINLHHLSDTEINTVINTSNFKTIHIFEIGKGTLQAKFLDSFITKYKSDKHQGNYLTVDKFSYIKYYKRFNYKWNLNLSIAKEYLTKLFRLDKDPSLDLLDILNYDGETLDWSLDYIKLEI